MSFSGVEVGVTRRCLGVNSDGHGDAVPTDRRQSAKNYDVPLFQ